MDKDESDAVGATNKYCAKAIEDEDDDDDEKENENWDEDEEEKRRMEDKPTTTI